MPFFKYLKIHNGDTLFVFLRALLIGLSRFCNIKRNICVQRIISWPELLLLSGKKMNIFLQFFNNNTQNIWSKILKLNIQLCVVRVQYKNKKWTGIMIIIKDWPIIDRLISKNGVIVVMKKHIGRVRRGQDKIHNSTTFCALHKQSL
jgi:hypothetical protein